MGNSLIESARGLAPMDNDTFLTSRGMKTACGHCHREPEEGEVAFKKCSRCLDIRYCALKCQKAAWPKHKKVCKTQEEMLQWKRNNDLGIYSYRNDLPKVKALLAEGADPCFINGHDGGSVLMTASQQGHVEVARVLLAAGANANYAVPNGDNAFQFAAYKGHTELIELLLTVGGAKIDAQDSDGNTALLTASMGGHVDSVQLFLRLGANPSIIAGGNITASSVTRNPEILALLRARIAELAL